MLCHCLVLCHVLSRSSSLRYVLVRYDGMFCLFIGSFSISCCLFVELLRLVPAYPCRVCHVLSCLPDSMYSSHCISPYRIRMLSISFNCFILHESFYTLYRPVCCFPLVCYGLLSLFLSTPYIMIIKADAS